MMKRKQRRKEAIKKVEKKEKIKDKATLSKEKNSQQKVNYATDPKCLSQQSQVATKKL